ncbi:STAS domain-containing protein [Streptomyces sp. NBC_01220]|uniref:STAS domain-containing protein n=1 Tax=unclassified Streptomyces TaxID=2593676 RepID=UPI002E2D2558|nr:MULTISPECIES: STAS domain-containing protein [unclassified Streptomyces]WSQ48843.1 STAS domain-containing protein [Streptomyces sp. NBC_01220]
MREPSSGASEEGAPVLEPVGDGVVLVRVRGNLDDWAGSAELVEALTDVAEGGGRRTVVDLSGVDFADSAGLHALLHGQRKHDKAGVSLVVAGPLSAKVRRLFEVTGTLDAFRFADDVDAAITE